MDASWQEGGILWTQEPELYLSGNQVIVPRLKPDIEKNNRLNSGRRSILAEIDPRQESLNLGYDGQEPFFKFQEERHVPLAVDESFVKVQAHYSLAKALRIGKLGYFHLIQGKVAGSEDTVVALSDTNASSIQVPSGQLVTVKDKDKLAGSVLAEISADLVAQTLLSDLAPPGSSVLVHEPPSFYVMALSYRAAVAGVQLTFLSTKVAPNLDGIRWIQLHEKETQRNLRQKLPPNSSIFCDLASDHSPTGLSFTEWPGAFRPAALYSVLTIYLKGCCFVHIHRRSSMSAFQALSEAVGRWERSLLTTMSLFYILHRSLPWLSPCSWRMCLSRSSGHRSFLLSGSLWRRFRSEASPSWPRSV